MKTKIDKSKSRNKSSSPFFNSKNDSGFFNIQPKLKVGQPGDKYEVEADRVADEVVKSQSENQPFFAPAQTNSIQTKPNRFIQEKPIAESITPLIQRQEEEEEEAQAKLQDITVQRQEEEEEEETLQMQPMEEEEEELQMQPIEEEEEELQMQVEEEEEEMMQAKADSPLKEEYAKTEQLLNNSKGNGSSLDSGTQTQMEGSFGADFGGVKIHTDNAAIQLNKDLGAQAFTTGNNIYFNEGKYKPNSQNGKKLLAHELTHTVQQGATSAVSNQPFIQRWPWSSSIEEQKREFRSRNYGPLTYTRPETSGSGFETSYWPMSSRLNVTLRGKIRFADTLSGSIGSLSAPNIFMNQSSFIGIINALPADVQTRIMPYFQWTDEQKQIHLMRFQQNLEVVRQMWQGTGMSFQVNETGWEDITATPNITFSIGEGDAVHQTRQGGFLNLFTVTDEATSDHIQIEIVKQLTSQEADEIIGIITAHNTATGATVDRGMIQSTRSYMHNDPGSRGSAPQGFNNIMSMESNLVGDPRTRMYATDVYFGHNQSDMPEESTAQLDSFFSDPMILLDNGENAVNINLVGFASAPGSTSYNRSLVESRINTVQNYIDNHLMNTDLTTNIYTSENANNADTSAETDLATNPATHDPAGFRRVEITIIREGRGGQNTLAHEIGHVFGLGDEYAEVGGMYNRPTGSAATHDPLARNAGVTGGATVADDQRMMSGGNVFGAAHYSTFADALNQLTSKRWKIIT